MILLSLIALIMILALGTAAIISLLSGVGVLLIMCAASIICILLGVWLMIKLITKGIFSLLKCVMLIFLLAIPAVNVIALIIIVAYAAKAFAEDQ